MLDRVFVERKLELIREGIEKLREFEGKKLEELRKEQMEWDALEWRLAKLVGRAIDINQHILADKAEVSKKYSETFTDLSNIEVLPKDFSEKISESASFRNRIIHEYNNIDENLVYESVNDAIEQYEEYCKYILEYLEKESEE